MQLLVRGRSVQLEESKQSPGPTGQHVLQRGEGVLGPRSAAGSEILVDALKLLANQQMVGDSLVQVLVAGLQEQSRLNIME